MAPPINQEQAETVIPSDEALAKAIQQGDRLALNQLVQRYHAPLLGFLYRMTYGDQAVAEDLVQDTFVRLLRNIQKYDGKRPFRPWLYTIAKNLVRDHFKQAEMRYTESASTRLLAGHAGGQMPETEVAKQHEVERLMIALKALPLLYCEVIVLRYYQGLSLKEVAQILDVPVGTVKSRLSNGLTKLRQRLDR